MCSVEIPCFLPRESNVLRLRTNTMVPRLDGKHGCPLPCDISFLEKKAEWCSLKSSLRKALPGCEWGAGACHTAVQADGVDCYHDVVYAMTLGLQTTPEKYPDLQSPPMSSFVDWQYAVHVRSPKVRHAESIPALTGNCDQ